MIQGANLTNQAWHLMWREAIGYALGFLLQGGNWRKSVFSLGAILTLAFVILRVFRLYGNSQPSLEPWAGDIADPCRVQASLILTIASFLNTVKYPPSLQYLLMTLGPALMALAWFDRVDADRWSNRILLVFVAYPWFTTCSHLFLIHTMAVWIALALHQPAAWLLYGGPLLQALRAGYGHGLPYIYLMWATVLVLLYPPVAPEFQAAAPRVVVAEIACDNCLSSAARLAAGSAA
jgi:hypothetical protein